MKQPTREEITQEQIDKFIRLRSKGVSIAAMANLKHFNYKELKEL